MAAERSWIHSRASLVFHLGYSHLALAAPVEVELAVAKTLLFWTLPIISAIIPSFYLRLSTETRYSNQRNGIPIMHRFLHYPRNAAYR